MTFHFVSEETTRERALYYVSSVLLGVNEIPISSTYYQVPINENDPPEDDQISTDHQIPSDQTSISPEDDRLSIDDQIPIPRRATRMIQFGSEEFPIERYGIATPTFYRVVCGEDNQGNMLYGIKLKSNLLFIAKEPLNNGEPIQDCCTGESSNLPETLRINILEEIRKSIPESVYQALLKCGVTKETICRAPEETLWGAVQNLPLAVCDPKYTSYEPHAESSALKAWMGAYQYRLQLVERLNLFTQKLYSESRKSSQPALGKNKPTREECAAALEVINKKHLELRCQIEGMQPVDQADKLLTMANERISMSKAYEELEESVEKAKVNEVKEKRLREALKRKVKKPDNDTTESKAELKAQLEKAERNVRELKAVRKGLEKKLKNCIMYESLTWSVFNDTMRSDSVLLPLLLLHRVIMMDSLNAEVLDVSQMYPVKELDLSKTSVSLERTSTPAMFLLHRNQNNYRIASTRFGRRFVTCALSKSQGDELKKLLGKGTPKETGDKDRPTKTWKKLLGQGTPTEMRRKFIHQFYEYLARGDVSLVTYESLLAKTQAKDQ
eukprot:Protomagalhaensia_wolfi_Nauph_80__5859@NODE_749_length_2033_cov_53_569208_g562_i0_p1_GENE_NODE_749_length_2033_cov_53_569208_g562_i0NODE_749_length_2033_cov_53_569208_g562_i0_p1_ORF_typecomplete_len556_score98_86DUF5525/PF17663_1/0_018FapA/PF03961_13/0_059Prominin/PF05478_11/0_28LXG/PF04740_12/0_4DUF4795/PF16043_5/0_18DUF4795/PF16043_5/3_6e03DUF4164/PF13747_6/1_4AAA_13/PF13166_6/1_5MerRDNAbind/PF09278_11/1_5e02MerRDNAbind/PF09278_11/6_3Cast/PF10174_9/3_2UPF0242/PF06785_11/3_8Macoilin/PF09726_9/9